MKLLGTAFHFLGAALSLFCVATFLTQLLLLGTLLARGILNQDKWEKLQAVASGVDYSQIRADLLDAEYQAENDPVSLASNDLVKIQDRALSLSASNIALTESRLRELGRRFAIQEDTFGGQVATLETNVLQTTRKQLVQLVKNMAADQVKDHMVRMVKDQALDDVLGVIRELNTGEQTKIFASFQTDEEKGVLNEILKKMRQPGNPANPGN